ncbi:ATP-dependent RNA helicase ded1, partial [Colletotrichum sp. SAR 10_65]
MADQLNMSGLNIQDQQNQPRSYIPPHMRGKINGGGGGGGPPPAGPPPMNGGLNNSAWAG